MSGQDLVDEENTWHFLQRVVKRRMTRISIGGRHACNHVRDGVKDQKNPDVRAKKPSRGDGEEPDPHWGHIIKR